MFLYISLMLKNSGDSSPYLLLLPDLVFFNRPQRPGPMPLNYSKCLGWQWIGKYIEISFDQIFSDGTYLAIPFLDGI